MSFSNAIHAVGAPQHFERIARCLLQKRKNGDYSTCDLRIDLRNSHEMVHSVVVCAHSSTLLKLIENVRPPYAPFDMRSFDEQSVRKIIDWMYSGEIKVPSKSIIGDLSVASFLGVSMLQREFETHFKKIAESGQPIAALNFASIDNYLVSDETMTALGSALFRNLSKLSDADIESMTLSTVIAVMASLLPAEKKVPLVNLAIEWIHLKNADRQTINMITKSIVISDMTYDSLYSIRNTISQYLTSRDLVSKTRVLLSPDGDILLSVDSENAKKMNRQRSSSCDPRALNNPRNVNVLNRTKSELSFINQLPNPFDAELSEIMSSWTEPTGFPPVVKNAQYRDRSRAARQSVSGNSVSRNVEKIGSCSRKQIRRSLDRSSSEKNAINMLPDPFAPTDRSRAARQSDSGTSISRNVEKIGSCARSCEKKMRRSLDRSSSEKNAINMLPDPFAPPQKSWMKFETDTCTKKKLRTLGRTKSEISALNALPDPFDEPSEVQLVIYRNGNDYPKTFTKSEVEELRNMKDPFEKSEKSSRFSRPCVSPREPSCFNMTGPKTGVFVGHTRPFDLAKRSKSLKPPQRMIDNRTPSEIMSIHQMPDPFTNSETSPIMMPPMKGCVTPMSSKKSSSSARSATFTISPATRQLKFSPLRRSASEIKEINELPSIVSRNGNEEQIRRRKKDKYQSSFCLYPK